MYLLKYVLLPFLCAFISIFSVSAQTVKVNQQIQYTCPDASEVYIVWGVNNWQEPEKNKWPAGTYKKGNLLFTPMSKIGDGFTTSFGVENGTVIDFVFWVTAGPHNISADIWDTNVLPLQDYHVLASNDNTVVINSKIKIRPKESLSLLNYSGMLLFIFVLFLATILFIRRYYLRQLSFSSSPERIIFCLSCVLLFTLFFIRASVVGISWDLYYEPLQHLPKVLWAGFYDYLYTLFLGTSFTLFLHWSRRSSRVTKIILITYIGIAFFSLVAALLNIKVVELIGKPFNYRWFYYSDFLKSPDSQSAVSSNISPDYVSNLLCICATVIIASFLTIALMELFLKRMQERQSAWITFFILNFTYVIFAQRTINQQSWSYDKLANPVTAFLESVNPLSSEPELFTMPVADSIKANWTAKTRELPTLDFDCSKITNVLVVVLESTAAEYVAPYDSKYNSTPNLQKHLSEAIVFDNMYAHAPATNKSLFSLMCSTYPWLSYHTITYEKPEVNLPSLSSELASNGYKTAFFNSGDNDFQKAGTFLSARKFQTIKDHKDINCNAKFRQLEEKWEPLDGADDACAADAMIDWINNNSSDPFLAVLWTYQTHYPYYYNGVEKDFGVGDPYLNRYLNAVHHGDSLIGKIIENLKAKNLYESTLLVILGDHGEAFGRHNQVAHASYLYEENLRVPCIFINPAFTSEKRSVLGGMVDITPTIFNILQKTPRKEWQGQSLFANNRKDRTYFYCPWSDYLFGFREGNKKVIFNATKNRTEVYELDRDPLETTPLELSETESEIYHQKLACWVQEHNSYLAPVIGELDKESLAHYH